MFSAIESKLGTASAPPSRVGRRWLLVLCLLALASGTLARSAQAAPSQAAPSQGPSEHVPAAAAAAADGPEQKKPPAGSASRGAGSPGKQLYARYCALCHAADGSGYAADHAPSLVSPLFLASASDAFIADGIRLGRPNTAMAAYGQNRGGPLDDQQIAAIVAFLRADAPPARALAPLQVTGDAQRGAALFDQHCLSCHGDGTRLGTAPQLQNREFLAAASPAFLRYTILHGRPPTPMPAYEGQLASADIDDLVAWLASLTPAPKRLPSAAPKAAPNNLPLLINPKGRAPEFKLREGRFVSAAQVKRALDEKRRIIIIDARAPSDWIQFHIPGAVVIPYYDAAKIARIPNDGTWVVAYCACPHHASGEIVDALRQRGHPHTAVLDEGILFWRDQGYPVTGEAVAPKAKR
jgi:mono/diheme cytochrome c family protein/rhodanese-related sulfurtransferase